MTVATAAVLLTAVLAVVWDVRTRRIPNVLTFGSALAAIVFALATGGLTSVGVAIAAWGVGVLLFLPFFALGGMGAGDVKLLAALGAWLGPMQAVWLALFSSICGAALALVVAVFTGYLRTAFGNLWLMVMHWRTMGPSPVPGLTLRDAASPRLAYAIPIAMGVACTLWLR